MENVEVAPTVASPQRYEYRNRITVHAEGIALLLLGPSMLVPAAMLVWIKRRA